MASLAQKNLSVALTIVCCHSIFFGDNPSEESDWALESFQKSTATKLGEHLTFLEHIRAAYTLFTNHQNEDKEVRVLLFSGGPTKAAHPSKSEAESYLAVLKKLEDLTPFVNQGPRSKIRHIGLEEQATDSYQNILFGILECYRLVGRYPDLIRVLTHEFKRERMEVHRKAIRWNKSWQVIGINPPFDEEEEKLVTRLELENALIPFQNDLYGVRGRLKEKRHERGWKEESIQEVGRGQPEAVQQLLVWNGGETGHEVFSSNLPWEIQNPNGGDKSDKHD